ncbi:MAG: hypothetical protein QW056_02215 [Candidatus Bathyarchaeia archaeon]
MEKRRSFEEAFIEAVDEGLLMLGEAGREIIYFRLRHDYGLRREEIPRSPKIFMNCLRNLLGKGAEVIEKSIIKSLYGKLGIKFVENRNLGFLDYIEEAKSKS